MIEIIDAKYSTKDVTNIIKNHIINGEIYLRANNNIFGDPNMGVVKKLIVNYVEDGNKKTVEIVEGDFLRLPETNTDRLGIFYTNNNINNNIIQKSLKTINIAAKKHNVDVLTCVWTPIENNPFKEIFSPIRIGNLFNINYQILILLLTAKRVHDYKYVSFLEHDVLYGEDYFTYPEFDGNIIANNNYIGCNNGFQKNNHTNHQPLHELTMKFDFAINHFSKNLPNNIVDMAVLEPQVEIQPYNEWSAPQPSIHIFHGKHITSHYSIYSNEVTKNNKYWGDYEKLLV